MLRGRRYLGVCRRDRRVSALRPVVRVGARRAGGLGYSESFPQACVLELIPGAELAENPELVRVVKECCEPPWQSATYRQPDADTLVTSPRGTQQRQLTGYQRGDEGYLGDNRGKSEDRREA